MGKLVLKSGDIIYLTEEQDIKFAIMYLTTKDMTKQFSVPGFQPFRLNEVVMANEDKAAVLQTEMYTGIYPQTVHKKGRKYKNDGQNT